MSASRPGHTGCHCCPEFTPHTLSGSDPVEPSDPRVKAIIDETTGEVSLTTENVITTGLSATVAVSSDSRGTTAAGSRRVTIDVNNPGAGKWVAGVILWDDSGYTYDPSMGGSVSSLSAIASMRYERTSKPLVRSDGARPNQSLLASDSRPAVIFQPVIEQGGNRFYGWRSDVASGVGGSSVVLPDPVDICWFDAYGLATDGPRHHLPHRTPYHAEGRHAAGMPSVVDNQHGSPVGRCDDWLCTLNTSTGEFETDSRPDLSWDRTSRPITRFGVWVALSGEDPDNPAIDPGTPAGNYTLNLLIDDLTLEISTWGVLKIADADIGSPPNWGTKVIDESGSSVPGWTDYGNPIEMLSGDPAKPNIDETCGGIGSFSLVNGAIGISSVSAGGYQGGRLQTEVSIPTFSPGSQIVMEWTWRAINNRDHFDGGAGPDSLLSRKLKAGMWLGGLFRLTGEREGADDHHLCGVHKWWSNAPATEQGYFHANPFNIGSFDFDFYSNELSTCSLNQRALSRPLDGDRIMVVLQRMAHSQPLWNARVYVHGRPMPVGTDSYLWSGRFLRWVPRPDGLMTVGLIGLCGGGWSDIRLWIRQ